MTGSYLMIGMIATVLAILLGLVGDRLNTESAEPRRRRDVQRIMAAASRFRTHYIGDGSQLWPSRAQAIGRPAGRVTLRVHD
jgi:hypothetical protein